MQRGPRITIGMPVYNGAKYLPIAIDSLLNQTFEHFELLISDNASSDQTEEIGRTYAAKDRRIRYVRLNQNIGAAGNFNRVCNQAGGEYFKWAAHDDVCLPTFLERCLNALDAAPRNVVLCMPKTTLIDGNGDVIGDQDDRLDFRERRASARMAHFATRILASGCHAVFGLIRAEALRKTRLIGPFVASDVVLLGELALEGELWELPDRLFLSRIHEGCSHQIRTAKAYAEWFDPAKRRTFAGFVRTRLFVEQFKSIARTSLPPLEKLTTAAAFGSAWIVRQARVDAGAARRNLQDRLRNVASRRPRSGGTIDVPAAGPVQRLAD
jgi:glycosyltransferase involved in cell wall biosynthesis